MEDVITVGGREPRLTAVLAEELSVLWRRFRLQLAGIGIFLTLYGLWPLLTSGVPILGLRSMDARLMLPDNPWGSLLWVIIHAAVAVYWALAIWHDLPRSQREMFFTPPVPRGTHLLLRTAAGAILLASVVVLTTLLTIWFQIAITYTATAYPGVPLSRLLVPPVGWVMAWGGIVNLYLFASLLCIRFRQPERLLLLYVPLGVLSLLLTTFLVKKYLPDASAIASVIDRVTFSPDGVLSGFGFPLWNIHGVVWEVHLLAPVIWLPVWAGLLWLVARRERLG